MIISEALNFTPVCLSETQYIQAINAQTITSDLFHHGCQYTTRDNLQAKLRAPVCSPRSYKYMSVTNRSPIQSGTVIYFPEALKTLCGERACLSHRF